MLTFYEILRRQKISAIGAYSTVAEIKHLHQVDIDRLQNREDPTISRILLQKVTPTGGQETMILCTSYGLLIYECYITKIAREATTSSKTEEESKKAINRLVEEKASKKKDESENEAKNNDKPKIALSATYKLSVLPDERILDCLSFEAT